MGGLVERHAHIFQGKTCSQVGTSKPVEDTYADCGHVCQEWTRSPGVDTCPRFEHMRQVWTLPPSEDTHSVPSLNYILHF